MNVYAKMRSSAFFVEAEYASLVKRRLDVHGYIPRFDGAGNINGLSHSGDTISIDEDQMFEAIAPYVRSSSHIEMEGNTFSFWRWVFDQDRVNKWTSNQSWYGETEVFARKWDYPEGCMSSNRGLEAGDIVTEIRSHAYTRSGTGGGCWGNYPEIVRFLVISVDKGYSCRYIAANKSKNFDWAFWDKQPNNGFWANRCSGVRYYAPGVLDGIQFGVHIDRKDI